MVEALVPDFRGDLKAVETIVNSGLDVYAHNVETVYRLQYRVRDPRAGYKQSLETLEHAKKYAQSRDLPMFTKTSIMLGLGETHEELVTAFDDLRAYQVDVLTLGQYLRPSLNHLPVERYLSPEEFQELDGIARAKNFLYTASGPMVRSSYKAAEFFIEGLIRNKRHERATSHGI
jgi:lipoic acid synthetase